ncbi:MAG: DUF6178 family protein [Thermodesulfobacteriota bacterium]|nr:DUF6178 family protein [Thermodesulfobacteriota bacterium]
MARKGFYVMEEQSYTKKSPADLLKLDAGETGRFLDQLPLPDRIDVIMRASAKERQALILLTSHPEKVMALFPPEELFFTIKEIGATDALPLISLTTPEQLHLILDIDWWQKDRLRPDKIFEWLRLLFACSEDKVAAWLNTVEFALLVSLFKYFADAFKVGTEEDRLEEIDAFPPFTVDNYYFIRFKKPGVQETLGRIVEIAREINPKLYFDLMESMIWDVEVESEEAAYKWRQARLAEHGVPTFHEALDIYKPPSIPDPSRVRPVVHPSLIESDIESKTPAPVYPLTVPERPTFLLKVLELIGDQELLDRIKREWAHVCNHVVMADVLDFDEMKDIRRGLQKASRYLNIGLEYISQGQPEQARQLLEATPLTEIFRFGYAQTIALKKKAVFMVNKGYVEKDLSPADEPWRWFLAGGLRRHPLYYDPFGEDRMDRDDDYRDFGALREVEETKERLEEAGFIGRLMKERFTDYGLIKDLPLATCNIQMAIDLTWSVILFTVVSQKLLSNTPRLWPLTVEELHTLFPRLWAEGSKEKGRKLSPDIKEEMEKTLLGPFFSPAPEERGRITRYLEVCHKRIEEEMGLLDTRIPIDPRYIHVLLVEI